jgi:hypothetical protein
MSGIFQGYVSAIVPQEIARALDLPEIGEANPPTMDNVNEIIQEVVRDDAQSEAPAELDSDHDDEVLQAPPITARQDSQHLLDLENFYASKGMHDDAAWVAKKAVTTLQMAKDSAVQSQITDFFSSTDSCKMILEKSMFFPHFRVKKSNKPPASPLLTNSPLPEVHSKGNKYSLSFFDPLPEVPHFQRPHFQRFHTPFSHKTYPGPSETQRRKKAAEIMECSSFRPCVFRFADD